MNRKFSEINSNWPQLPAVSDWVDTLNTIHLWSQIVGKIRMTHTPWTNHSWHVTLYVSSRGLTTSLIPHSSGAFEIEFNFVEHKLEIRKVTGQEIIFDLEPMSVADLYSKTFDGLRQMDLETKIYPMPSELPDPIVSFPENTGRAAYDAESVHRFWQSLTHIHRVFTQFRADFKGKVSPVHFFWGSFDLAVTRFSGRTAPKFSGDVPNCPDWVMEESYSREMSSAGFWPGIGLGEAAFYSYAYPEPEGYRDADIKPEATYYDEELGEYILPYRAVKEASNPDKALLGFLQTTYEAAAKYADWNRDELEATSKPDR